MEDQQQLLNRLLHILTPEVINELTTTSEGHKRIPLTQVINEKLAGNDVDIEKIKEGMIAQSEIDEYGDAKILPFPSNEDGESSEIKADRDEQEEFIDYPCGKQSEIVLAEFMQNFVASQNNIFAEKRKKKVAMRSKETSTFIIDEKKKFEENYFKLKSKEVINLYKENASVDIDHQRNTQEDLSKSSQSGVLVNKKQA